MKMCLFILTVFIGIDCFAQQEQIIYPHVDVFNKDGSIRGRGKIIEVGGSKYKIRFDGCDERKDVTVDTSLTKRAYEIQKTDSSLSPIFGTWDLRRYDYPKDFVPNTKEPPLTIQAGGLVIWNDAYGKPGVISNWYQYAKLPGAAEGADAHNCVVIMDRYQQFYRAYVDTNGKLRIQRFCSDQTIEGTRLQ